jgi:hypothetical protein
VKEGGVLGDEEKYVWRMGKLDCRLGALKNPLAGRCYTDHRYPGWALDGETFWSTIITHLSVSQQSFPPEGLENLP